MSSYQITDRVIDNKTGKELSNKTLLRTVTKLIPEPPFVKMYLDDICNLMVCSDPSRKLLSCLLSHMDYENRVVLIKETKEIISKCSGMTLSHISKSISELKSKSVLIPIGRAYYLVNPKYFGKGQWLNIHELRLSIVYNKEGVVVDVKRKNEETENDLHLE